MSPECDVATVLFLDVIPATATDQSVFAVYHCFMVCVHVFQLFPRGALGGDYFLHDSGAACCVWDGEITAGAAATTTTETGVCLYVWMNTTGRMQTMQCSNDQMMCYLR